MEGLQLTADKQPGREEQRQFDRKLRAEERSATFHLGEVANKEELVAKKQLQPATSVAEFIQRVKEAQPLSGFLTFRGHRESGWKVEPSINRPPRSLLNSEKQAVRDLLSIHPQEFAGDHSMFDRLVRMQHYGLPTRLLDVTSNPLVALYFATTGPPLGTPEGSGEVVVFAVPESRKKYYDSDAVSCISNLANLSPTEKAKIEALKNSDIRSFNDDPSVDRLLQFIREEKPYFRANIDPIDLFRANYVVPKLSNRRIIAQSGAFLIYGLSTARAKSGRELIIGNRIPIPAGAKFDIRAELEMLGINESTLFPAIESAARYVARRYGA